MADLSGSTERMSHHDLGAAIVACPVPTNGGGMATVLDVEDEFLIRNELETEGLRILEASNVLTKPS